jgi:glyoxylase-like metal-dependent hydrolase (beta-lactamase superfamily II)
MGAIIETKTIEIRKGIVLFAGKISRHLMLEPMVSNGYLLDEGDEVIIFDPSCGKEMGRRMEAFIRERRAAKTAWQRALLIAGHSHFDHANNFYLSDVIGAEDTHIYVHESGFRNGKVMNEPAPFIRKVIEEARAYYNPYLSFFAPYNLLLYPYAALDMLSQNFAARLFSWTGSIHLPSPNNGSVLPEPLKEADAQLVDVGEPPIKGWPLNNKVIIPTPGHSPCSVSLLWPERKALFLSDADWIGNPVFMSSSIRNCITSLEKMKDLTIGGMVELLLPAHGNIKEGQEAVLCHLDFHIGRLEMMRREVLSAHRSCGGEIDVRKLTKILVCQSPLFRTLKLCNYPRFVIFVHNMVALCLKEEGILP